MAHTVIITSAGTHPSRAKTDGNVSAPSPNMSPVIEGPFFLKLMENAARVRTVRWKLVHGEAMHYRGSHQYCEYSYARTDAGGVQGRLQVSPSMMKVVIRTVTPTLFPLFSCGASSSPAPVQSQAFNFLSKFGHMPAEILERRQCCSLVLMTHSTC
jgi:hypothetical protein